MEIIYSTRTYRNATNKRPSIESNEGPQRKYVQIKAFVVTNPDSTYPITIKPYKFDISQYGEKPRKKLEFAITNVSDEDLEVRLVDMPPGMFKLSLPKKVKAGKTEKGKIELFDELVTEEFEKSLTIELSDQQKSRFTVPVKRVIRIPGTSAIKASASGK